MDLKILDIKLSIGPSQETIHAISDEERWADIYGVHSSLKTKRTEGSANKDGPSEMELDDLQTVFKMSKVINYVMAMEVMKNVQKLSGYKDQVAMAEAYENKHAAEDRPKLYVYVYILDYARAIRNLLEKVHRNWQEC